MNNIKKMKILLVGILIGAFIALPVFAEGTFTNNSTTLDEQKYVVDAKTDFGAIGDGITDDTQALQNAFDYCSENHTTLFIPNGNYLFTNLTMNASFNIEGEHRKFTVLKSKASSGAALDICGISNVEIANFTIVSAGIVNGVSEALDYGIKIDSDTDGNHPEFITILDIEIGNLRKENAVGCYVNNAKYLNCTNSTFHTLNGTAFRISGTNSSAGVFNFNTVLFGNYLSGKYGLAITEGSTIDSIAFEGCFFGAKKSAEFIDNGSNSIKSIIHNGCHYENGTLGETQLVEIIGSSNYNDSGMGLSWYNCSFGGFGKCKSAFGFAPDRIYNSISVKDCEFNNILNSGYIFNSSNARFMNCEVKIGAIVMTRPKMFAELSFRDDSDWVGGWTIIDTFTDFQNGLKIGGARVTAYADMPTSGSFNVGDIAYNVGVPVELGLPDNKYIIEGWKRLTTGNSHVLNVDWLEMRVLTGR